jgi:hypothetical protein
VLDVLWITLKNTFQTIYLLSSLSKPIFGSVRVQSHNSIIARHGIYQQGLFQVPSFLFQLTLTQKAIEQIETKISRTKELIRDEQTSRDNNVNEYLKLSANAERQQQNRIKQVKVSLSYI